MKPPQPHLTRRERELAGWTTVRVSLATRRLLEEIRGPKTGRFVRNVEDVVYELAANAMDGNGFGGAEERARLEAPFRNRSYDVYQPRASAPEKARRGRRA